MLHEGKAMRNFALLFLLAAVPVTCAADESLITLKQGPGLEKVDAYCRTCHSLDYIPMNSPFLDERQWDAEVAKMIKAFGAPIPPEDAKIIADYLKANYGG